MNIEDVTGPIDWKTTAKLYEEMLKDAYERINELEEAMGEPIVPLDDEDILCVICGRLVDTVEECDGGSIHGCETENGWVCSNDCYEALLKKP